MYFKEIIDEFNCGKKIRRASWPIGIMIDRNNDRGLNIEDLLAEDWEFIEDKKQWWEPKKDEEYYIICGYGSIDYNNYDGDYDDKRFMAIGNCFQTKDHAEFMAEKLKVIHEMEKFAYENNEVEIDWNDVNQAKYHLLKVSGDIRKIYIKITSTFMLKENPFNVYFTSEEIARKAIDTIGGERILKYYFGVNEDGRK